MKTLFSLLLLCFIFAPQVQAASPTTVTCRSDADVYLKLSVLGNHVQSAQWIYYEWGGHPHAISPENVVYRGTSATVAGETVEYVAIGDYTCGDNL